MHILISISKGPGSLLPNEYIWAANPHFLEFLSTVFTGGTGGDPSQYSMGGHPLGAHGCPPKILIL